SAGRSTTLFRKDRSAPLEGVGHGQARGKSRRRYRRQQRHWIRAGGAVRRHRKRSRLPGLGRKQLRSWNRAVRRRWIGAGIITTRMWLVFAWVFRDQIGLPLPATPALLGAGALARGGRMDLGLTIALATLASILGHAAWYEAGRRRGRTVLQWLCRI